MLTESDIEFLVEHEDDAPLWAVGATQQNSRIDTILSSLGIRDWGLNEFIETLCEKVNDDSFFHDVDEQDVAWLKEKPAAWLQRFYALLYSEEATKHFA